MRGEVEGVAAVRAQAEQLATAWSGAGAPPSWALTAALFATLATIRSCWRSRPGSTPIASLAPVRRLGHGARRARPPDPLARALPAGDGHPPLPADFAGQLRAFCLAHGDELLALAGAHRYQMSEPHAARTCCPRSPPSRPTCAGRWRSSTSAPARASPCTWTPTAIAIGAAPPRSRSARPTAGTLGTELRGPRTPPLPVAPPPVAVRVGIDTEPLDVADPAVRAWLRACTPPVAEALARFDLAADHAAAHRATTVRGDALEVLAGVVERFPADVHPCLLDAYVHASSPRGSRRASATRSSGSDATATSTGSHSTR